jgi:hypothetical protein
MSLFGGRRPDYNTAGDTWNRLMPEQVEKVARLAFLTALTVGKRGDHMAFEKPRDLGATWLPEQTQ